MSKGRHSNIVKLGRIYQNISSPLNYLEQLLAFPYYFGKPKVGNLICILAPPRSGSTLTYQYLTSQLKNFHLTNLSNLLYSTPLWGVILNNHICKNYQTNYKSNQGFVNGICGEAEGLKFWDYWSGQALEEDRKLKVDRLKKISNLLNRYSYKRNTPFITGYLGHVFLINELRKVFPRIIFIHLTRDLPSNISSILKKSPKSWYSVKPKNYESWNSMPRLNQIGYQVINIHSRILKDSKDDTILLDYKDLCTDPEKVLNDIIWFAKKREMIIELNKNREKIKSFNFQSIDKSSSEFIKIFNVLDKQIQDSHDKDFLYKLLNK